MYWSRNCLYICDAAISVLFTAEMTPSFETSLWCALWVSTKHMGDWLAVVSSEINVVYFLRVTMDL